jgi:signal transduction histidine kinase
MKPTILYIEDDPASRRLVERALTYAGYKVLVAERGLQGIDLARKTQPDLILTDINLPDLSGHEITTALRGEERFKQTPIVALTAQGYGIQHDMAIAAGINGYLVKPLDIEKLSEQVAYYLNGGQDVIDADRLSAAKARYTSEVVSKLEGRIRELEAANEALHRLDRMKETFIQLTAHELRTPLTLIFGYSRLLEDHAPLRSLIQHDDIVSTLLEGLGDAIERMHGVIEEILIISRIMTKQIELSLSPINLVAVMQKSLTTYESALKERRLEVRFDSNGWPTGMRADADLLRLAFNNLIGNAIKYTPDYGTITIWAETEDDRVRVYVRDTGIGINPSDQVSIFDEFHTVSDVKLHSTSKTAFGGGGLGLGLPICKGIVGGERRL